MPPTTRYTVRLPPALAALVQERIRTSGTPFAVLLREALSNPRHGFLAIYAE